MKAPTEESPAAAFATRVSPQELGQIITLRKNLDLMGVLGKFADEYLRLGWSLAALNAKTGDDLGINFTRPRSEWIKRLMDESLKGTEVNLAVRTGSPSRLMVVKVEPESGPHRLDGFGSWRSTCVARNTGGWEQHFYLLPSDQSLASSPGSGVEVLGETASALVPPSVEPDLEDTWRWLHAPWESPPGPPPPGLRRYLEESGLLIALAEKPPPAWQEVIARIAGHKDLLGALLIPSVSISRYYQKIITEALKAGFREPEMLQTLLWHAPHGDARRKPERWRGLLQVVAEVTRVASGLPVPPGQGVRPPEAGSPQPPRSLLQRLERLTARTRELERQLAALRQKADLGDYPAEKQKTPDAAVPPLWEEWLALIQRPSLDDKEIKRFQTAVADFLKANPDLAGDEGKLHLVLYSYATYIRVDPANEGLPYNQKLAKAGDLARKILNSMSF